MRETPDDLHRLQALLDTSLSRSTAHLRSIISSERTLTAEQLTGVLTGMCTLALSTVTAKGEPRVSGVDGHFLRGTWHFGTARGAAKARHPDFYGDDAFDWDNDVVFYRPHPQWMAAFAPDLAKLGGKADEA
ncbi:pyridoxamine 5'-phosphate oxidase family protein [Streptomyces laurentii]|uniref:pyridoxamine 5'-phosphate oxidase family protein n=1 Tax=Streptomyces laurentii TaxID=39478 RepID=UPI00367A3F8A